MPGVEFSQLVELIPFSANPAGSLFGLSDGTTTVVPNVGSLTITCTPAPDHKMLSIGKFQILVNPVFRDLMAGYPGYDSISKLTSPRLIDRNTVVGESAYHLDGDATDSGGATVGTAGTMISDSDFSLVPPGFEGPAGSREVHTEIRELDLALGPIHVRAGLDAPDQPISPGEVESQSATGNPAQDFPADSFFNVFVEIDLPAVFDFDGATLFNSDPLLIVGNNINSLPPKVVYIHGNTEAVPVFFKSTKTDWQAGDLFGWLVLAGHGAGFDSNDEDDIDEFDNIFEKIIEPTPLPVPDSDGGGAPDDLELAKGGDLENPADDAAILALDNDQDGCTNGQELGGNEQFGGLRDPLSYWDFYDVWTHPAGQTLAWERNQVINIFDIPAVAKRFGSGPAGDKATALAAALTQPVDDTSYHQAYDRGPVLGPNNWNRGPADGAISIPDDILGVAAQFGHNCT